MRCAHCSSEHQVLHLESNAKTDRNQESEDEAKQGLKGLIESFNQVAETMRAWEREMFDGTKYATREALIGDIAKRYNGQVAGEDIPFETLKPWMVKHSRKAQRKILLLYKQGPVCNRCDLRFAVSELTEDHIEGDRSRSQLTDLQLLCKKCNGEKGNNPPGPTDVSPFRFDGEPCVHRVACIEPKPSYATLDAVSNADHLPTLAPSS